MKRNTVEIRVGRLMEIRVDKGFASLDDVEAQRHMITEAMQTLAPTASVVIAADWRGCEVMSSDASNALGPMIGSFNARIERSALLAKDDAPTAVLQFLRVIRESKHPNRRLYQDLGEMTHWLGETLNRAELQRLTQFFLR